MRCRNSLVRLAILVAMLACSPAALPQVPPGAATIVETDETRIADLILAYRIMAARGVLDGRGHITARSVKNPTHYYMARVAPPGTLTRSDIVEFDADSKPVGTVTGAIFGERFIHGEIYRRRPDVQAVVHCHPLTVLPFTVSQLPLRAVIHTAYFLGTEAAPIFDLRSAEGEDNLMLVSNAASGAALATTLGKRSVVLMRGHGMAVAAPTVRDAVYRSIFTIANAEVEAQALQMGKPVFLNDFEVRRSELTDPFWQVWVQQAAAQP